MHGLLIDTNVLMLLLVGRRDRSRITSFRRTAIFTRADFELLERTLAEYAPLVTTAPVLTEVSNLMGNAFHATIADTLISVCAPFEERSASKDDILAEPLFTRLGFADASILLGTGEDTVVLTDDVHLYLAVLDRGFEAINFNHLRS